MAKIDTTKIEGYAGMTAEQKLAALEAFELPDNNSAELERLKNAVSKANSEAAEYKKQLRAKADRRRNQGCGGRKGTHRNGEGA